MSHRARYAGVYVAPLTPTDAEHQPDNRRYLAHCQWLLAQGCHGLMPLGSTGEGHSFTPDERIKLMDVLAEGGVPMDRMLVGASALAYPDAVRMIRHATKLGARAVAVQPAFYYKAGDEGLYAYFKLLVDQVVLAAGVWSGRLARELGVSLPLEGGKGYHVDFEAQPGDPTFPVWLHEHRVVITPLGARVRVAGTLELSGTDERIDQRRVDAIVQAATRAVPAFAGRPRTHVWRGLRPCTPDGLPVIGRAPNLDNLTLATGHGMWGLQLAPLTAELVASIVREERPQIDLSPLRPERFEPPWRHSQAARSSKAVRV